MTTCCSLWFRRSARLFFACCALNQDEMCSEMRGSVREEDGQYDRLALTHITHIGTGIPPREGLGDQHHAIIDPDEMIRHE